MFWKHIKQYKVFQFFVQTKKHSLFPIFTGASGVWLGMLVTPTIGGIFFVISLYSALVIWLPWDKIFRNKHNPLTKYIVSAILILLLIVPTWNKLISIFPTTDPYIQPLMIGKARVDVILGSEDKNIGTTFSNSWCYRGRILLVTGPKTYLEMYIATVPGIHIERTKNNQLRYSGELELYPDNKTTGQPISFLRNAECALVCIPDHIPRDANVIGGEVILTFNSSILVRIPIPPQKIEENLIIIENIQKYFKNSR